MSSGSALNGAKPHLPPAASFARCAWEVETIRMNQDRPGSILGCAVDGLRVARLRGEEVPESGSVCTSCPLWANCARVPDPSCNWITQMTRCCSGGPCDSTVQGEVC